MSKSRKIIFSISTIFLAATAWGYFYIWRSPKYFLENNTCKDFDKILSMQQYGELVDTHERPYIIRKTNVLVFGSEHIKDPDHEQNKTIVTKFEEFEPTVVLIEGRLGFHIPYFMDPVKNFGEMGKAAYSLKKTGYPSFHGILPKASK